MDVKEWSFWKRGRPSVNGFSSNRSFKLALNKRIVLLGYHETEERSRDIPLAQKYISLWKSEDARGKLGVDYVGHLAYYSASEIATAILSSISQQFRTMQTFPARHLQKCLRLRRNMINHNALGTEIGDIGFCPCRPQ
jgi:hypothetical protein